MDSGGREGREVPGRCCRGACHFQTGAIVSVLAEILVLGHSIIFLCANLAAGAERYARVSPNFALVVKADYLLPLVLIQSLCLLAGVAMLVGMKTLQPSLVAVYLFVKAIAVTGAFAFGVLFAVNLGEMDLSKVPCDVPVLVGAVFAIAVVEAALVRVAFRSYLYVVGAKTTAEEQKKRLFRA